MSIVPGVATPMAAIWSRRSPAAAHGRADGLAHPFQAEFLAAVRLGRQADAAKRPAVVIDDAGLHGRAADVQADI